MFLKHKSIFWHVVGSFIGLFFMMLFWFVANFIDSISDVSLIEDIVSFMNETLWLVILTWFLGFVGGCFDRTIFPLSIPGVLIHALNSIFSVYFFIKVLTFLDETFFIDFLEKILDWEYLGVLYPIAFFLTIFVKVLEIFNNNFVRHRENEKKFKEKEEFVVNNLNFGKYKLKLADFLEKLSKDLKK